MSCCKKGTHEWLNIPSLDPVIIDSMSDSECWIFVYSNIFEYFQLNIFISKYIWSFSVSRIYLDICSYNFLPPKYIRIFIRTIFSHPNIFKYSFGLLLASQIYSDIHLYPKKTIRHSLLHSTFWHYQKLIRMWLSHKTTWLYLDIAHKVGGRVFYQLCKFWGVVLEILNMFSMESFPTSRGWGNWDAVSWSTSTFPVVWPFPFVYILKYSTLSSLNKCTLI